MVFVASYTVCFLLNFFFPFQESQWASLVSVSASHILLQKNNCRGPVEFLVNQPGTSNQFSWRQIVSYQEESARSWAKGHWHFATRCITGGFWSVGKALASASVGTIALRRKMGLKGGRKTGKSWGHKKWEGSPSILESIEDLAGIRTRIPSLSAAQGRASSLATNLRPSRNLIQTWIYRKDIHCTPGNPYNRRGSWFYLIELKLYLGVSGAMLWTLLIKKDKRIKFFLRNLLGMKLENHQKDMYGQC